MREKEHEAPEGGVFDDCGLCRGGGRGPGLAPVRQALPWSHILPRPYHGSWQEWAPGPCRAESQQAGDPGAGSLLVVHGLAPLHLLSDLEEEAVDYRPTWELLGNSKRRRLWESQKCLQTPLKRPPTALDLQDAAKMASAATQRQAGEFCSVSPGAVHCSSWLASPSLAEAPRAAWSHPLHMQVYPEWGTGEPGALGAPSCGRTPQLKQ